MSNEDEQEKILQQFLKEINILIAQYANQNVEADDIINVLHLVLSSNACGNKVTIKDYLRICAESYNYAGKLIKENKFTIKKSTEITKDDLC